MDRQTIFRKCATYYHVIEKISGESLLIVPAVEKVFSSKSLMQKAYAEVREMKFDGRVIDFIAWISMAFMVDRVRTSISKGASIFEWARAICDQYHYEESHVKNFIRFWFFNNHSYLLLRAEISGESLDRECSSEEYNEQIKISSFLSALMSMIGNSSDRGAEDFIEKANIIFETLERMKLPE